MESRKGEPVDLNAVDVRSGKNNVQIEIELIYFALKKPDNVFCFFFLRYLSVVIEFLWFDISFRNEKYVFIFNENAFNTKSSELILVVVYKHCKIYPQTSSVVVVNS